MHLWADKMWASTTDIEEKRSLFRGELFMSVLEFLHLEQLKAYEIYCPFCGKWACDTSLKLGVIVIPCRECGKKIIIMNWGDGPFVFKDRRIKARRKTKRVIANN